MFCGDATLEKGSGHRLRAHSPGFYACWQRLPVELRAELTDAWIASLGDNTEIRVSDVSTRVLELRVVEDVEELDANVERQIFLDPGSLRDSEVRVVETGTMEEAAAGRTKGAQRCVFGERGWQEVASRSGTGYGRVECRASGVCLARVNNLGIADAVRHIGGRTAGQGYVAVALI